MHLKRDFNVPEFLSAVKKCEGEVFFCTPEGDRLTLRSAFCQYIFYSLLKSSATFYESDIVLEKKTDLEILQDYLQKEY